MMSIKRLFVIIAAGFIFSSFFLSCYYDSEEVLYPSFGCDTTNVTYQSKISVMISNYCISCHSGPFPEGSVSLSTYMEVMSFEPRITPAIKHTGPYPMPLNGGMLNECTLNQWDIWVRTGMPE
jgi:hypothetical protein